MVILICASGEIVLGMWRSLRSRIVDFVHMEFFRRNSVGRFRSVEKVVAFFFRQGLVLKFCESVGGVVFARVSCAIALEYPLRL